MFLLLNIQIEKNTITSEKLLVAVNDIGSKDDLKVLSSEMDQAESRLIR